MSLLVRIILAVALILSIAVSSGASAAGEKTEGRYKTALDANAFSFSGTPTVSSVFMFSGSVFAAETTVAASGVVGTGYLVTALSTGLACIGGGIAVSATANAALGVVSKDGSTFGKSLILVGFAEGARLYGSVISFMILDKL